MPNDEVAELLASIRALISHHDVCAFRKHGPLEKCTCGVADAADSLNRLAALARQGQEDRERLDWLSTQALWVNDRRAGPWFDLSVEREEGQDVRTAIDAARKAEGGEET